MSLTETRFSSVRARFPLRSGREPANIYTATLLRTVLYTYSRMLHLLVSLFVFFHLSVALPFFSLLTPCPLDGVRGCKKDGERGERSSALGGKVSRRAATISSLHGNAPSTPFSFATGTRLTLDKRTRSVVMFFAFFRSASISK